MTRTVTKIALSLIIICTSYFWFEAKACVCNPQLTPYGAYQDSRVVFVGKAVGSKERTGTEKYDNKTFSFRERVFEFAVTETLKGPKTSRLEISVGRIDSDCYQGFTIGESYLVYAYGDSNDNLSSSACGRTTNLSYAAADLHYIRNLLKGVPEPRVYGAVARVDSDLGASKSRSRVTPLSGIKVLIEGKDRNFEAVTDEQGLYSLARVPDGRYKAHPLLPKKYTAYFPTEEEFILGSERPLDYGRIQQGSSAYASFEIGWNNDVNGRIVDSEGNPIKRAKVSVLLARSPSPLLIQRDEYDYHAEGEFRFHGLNPGNYLLSVDIRAPFVDKARAPTFYYPNAIALNQAREISIGENEILDEREIRLPPGYIVRHIEGVLVWPNGIPVSSGWVTLRSSKDSPDDDNEYDWERTDELGRFSLQAFVGAEYWLHAESQSSGQGEPIKIKVEMVNEPFRIVIPFPKKIEP